MELVRRECLVFSDKEVNSNKFYILELNSSKEKGFDLVIKYGRFGSKPTVKATNYQMQYIAEREFNVILNKKLKKGYKQTDIDSIIANGDNWWMY